MDLSATTARCGCLYVSQGVSSTYTHYTRSGGRHLQPPPLLPCSFVVLWRGLSVPPPCFALLTDVSGLRFCKTGAVAWPHHISTCLVLIFCWKDRPSTIILSTQVDSQTLA